MLRSLRRGILLACAAVLALLAVEQNPDELFARAVKLHQSGELEGAMRAYEAFLLVRPDAVEAISNLGAVHARMGEYGKAIEQYGRALALAPGNAGILFNLGLAWYEAGDIPQAAEQLAKVVAAEPANTRAVLLLADCRFRMGEYRKVIELLSPLEASEGDNRALLYLLGTALIREKEPDRGQALVDRILRDGDSAEARLMLGAARMMTLDMPGAIAEFERAIELNPKVPTAHSQLARALLNAGDTARAMEALRRELEINPSDYDSNLTLGVLLRKEQQFEEALEHLQRALRTRPGAPDSRYQAASILTSLGKLEDARVMLEELVKEYPDFVEAHVTLATVYYRLKRREDGDRHRDIVRELNAELQARGIEHGDSLRPGEPAAAAAPAPVVEQPAAAPAPEAGGDAEEPFEKVIARAAAARESNRVEEAVALYRQAVRINPSWAEGWWYLGTLHYEADRYEDARGAFAQLVSLIPNAGPGWAMLGLCEFQLKEYEPALNHLQQARNLGLGGNEELTRVTRFHVSILLTRFGHPEAALPILDAMARLGPVQPALLEAIGLAVLGRRELPSEIPAADRDLVRKAGEAHHYVALRDPAKAREAFEALVAAHRNAPGVRYAYGVFLLTEEPDRALEEFRQELKVSPSHVNARLQIAFEYLKRGEFEAGLPYAQEGVVLAPDQFAARNVLGQLLLGLDQFDRAIKELEIGVKLAPDSPETRFALARAYARAGRAEDAARERTEFSRLEKERRRQRTEAQQSGLGAQPRPDDGDPPG